MTDNDGGYTAPPATGEPVDPSAGQPYGTWGQQPYPPGYGAPYPYGYPAAGYPPPGYPSPYYGAMPYNQAFVPAMYGPRRPGQATAAAVLGFVNSGFLIIAALFLFAGASIVNDIDNADGGNTHHYAAEFTFDGLLNLLAAALLISGGVMLTNRSVNGRWLYTAGAVVVLGEAIYWLVRFSIEIGLAGFIFWSVVYTALAVVGVSLAWTGGVTSWLIKQEQTTHV